MYHASKIRLKSPATSHQRFKVRLWLCMLGPVRERTKYKENKAFSAEQCVTLPFVPYPGMGLTIEKPGRRTWPLSLYLRVRSVAWHMPEEEFVCTVDEVLGDPSFSDRHEARGPARSEREYTEMLKAFETFGFDVKANVSVLKGIKKHADGSWINPIEAEEEERLLHWQMKDMRDRASGG